MRALKWTLFYMCLAWAVLYARLLWFVYDQLPHALELQPPGMPQIIEGIFYLIFVGLVPVGAASFFLRARWPERRRMRVRS